MPRATTAAWLVMPPRVVRMPRAACMPCMSSGLVSIRISTTASPLAARISASSELNTATPDAAPGLAGRPLLNTVRGALGSSVGCSNWSRDAGLTRLTASLRSISPASAISTAIRKDAAAVRFPLRVWSMYSLFCCTVNSMSCMSR